jgi:hypothetical protein
MAMRMALICGCLCCAAASASLTEIGEPAEGGSWISATIIEDGVYSSHDHAFDFVGMIMVSPGDYFDSPGIRSFDRAGWSTLYQDDPDQSRVVGATGPSVPVNQVLQFKWHFEGAKADVPQFDWVVFSGGSIVGACRISMTPSGGLGAPVELTPSQLASLEYSLSTFMVPSPDGVVLGIIGCAGLLATRRRL